MNSQPKMGLVIDHLAKIQPKGLESDCKFYLFGSVLVVLCIYQEVAFAQKNKQTHAAWKEDSRAPD